MKNLVSCDKYNTQNFEYLNIVNETNQTTLRNALSAKYLRVWTDNHAVGHAKNLDVHSK